MKKKNSEISNLGEGNTKCNGSLELEELEEVSGGVDCGYNVNCPKLIDPPPPPDY